MDSIKISVVIPVYNVEKYLRECLDSVINQTLNDIEIIFVNDGSTDNSSKILDEYAENDSRIKVIHKENGGLSSARNVGIENATGEYISFIDSDDWVELNLYEKLINIINTYSPDVICYGINICGDVSSKQLESDEKYYKIKYNGLIELTDKIIHDTDVASINKLYKTDIIRKNGLEFPIGRHYEDYPFYFEYMLLCKKAYFLPDKYYNYRRRSDSIMSGTFNGTSDKIIDHLYNSELIYNFMKKNNLYIGHEKMFKKIFKECFWFSYNFMKDKVFVLKEATKLAKRLGIENKDKDIYYYLRRKKYHKIKGIEKDILEKIPKQFGLSSIFSIYNSSQRKIINIWGVKISYKSKKLEERERYRVLNKKLDKISKELKIIKKELINAKG